MMMGDDGDGHELDWDVPNEERVAQPIKYQRANETKRAKRETATNGCLKPRTLPKDYFGAAPMRAAALVDARCIRQCRFGEYCKWPVSGRHGKPDVYTIPARR
jgi:hypothetical protein